MAVIEHFQMLTKVSHLFILKRMWLTVIKIEDPSQPVRHDAQPLSIRVGYPHGGQQREVCLYVFGVPFTTQVQDASCPVDKLTDH